MQYISIDLMMTMRYSIRTAFAVLSIAQSCSGFVAVGGGKKGSSANRVSCFRAQNEKNTSSYETSDASSKGIVSSLTGLVNLIMTRTASKQDGNKDALLKAPPSSATELMNRIRDDYVVNNYLWTGNIDLASFEKDCRFSDPTLSFVGRDKFVSNVENLRIIVDKLVEPGDCRSDLLEITLNKEKQYVASRWNMVGKLNALPWKPRIDVIGRTKFWYRKVEGGYRVYFYDECWELAAAKALLHLVTPAGTIPNRNQVFNDEQ